MVSLACCAAVAMSLVLLAAHVGCSADEEAQFADVFPKLAPATQAVERAEAKIDPIAATAAQGAAVMQSAAGDAAAIGIPGAGVVALIASLAGTAIGIYNERRRGTVPLRSAITQIVQSVETAFPTKSAEQKSALSAAQDQSTKQLVNQIKGS